jgi:hypothetical protein
MAESYGGALDFLRAVIPSTTIVGSALRGDATGAAARTVGLVKGAQSKPPTADQLALMGAGAPGGGMFGSGIPSWLPLVAIAGVGAAILLKKKKGRR